MPYLTYVILKAINRPRMFVHNHGEYYDAEKHCCDHIQQSCVSINIHLHCLRAVFVIICISLQSFSMRPHFVCKIKQYLHDTCADMFLHTRIIVYAILVCDYTCLGVCPYLRLIIPFASNQLEFQFHSVSE